MTAFRRRRQSHQRDRRTSYCRGLSQHLPLFQQCCEDQSRSVAKSLATAETTITHIFNIYIDNSTNCTVTQLQLTTTPIYSFFSRTTRVSRCQEGKTSVHLNEARDDGGFWDGSGISWTICKQFVPISSQITKPTPHN